MVHEWWPTHHQLVDEDAQRIPISRPPMPLVQDYFWSHVLWSTAQRIGTFPLLDLLHEAEVGYFDVAIITDQYVFRLKVPINQVFGVKVLKSRKD